MSLCNVPPPAVDEVSLFNCSNTFFIYSSERTYRDGSELHHCRVRRNCPE